MPTRYADERSYRADIAACRRLLRGGSQTFHAASLLLPRAVREPASALYAFCRLADDAVDLNEGRIEAVQRLRERLHRACEGRPLPAPADRALAAVVERFGIPAALPEALLEGLEWDATGRRYEDLEGVCAYGARVAGSVGAMMALVMGARSRVAVARACDLGVAMQLSNIARDVGEDARAGRIYLPLQWMRDAGLDPEVWLAAPHYSAALGAVVQCLLDAADALYQRATPGIGLLPLACRPGIHAAGHLYAAIGWEVAARGLDSVSQRAVVPAGRKATLLAQALVAALLPHAEAAGPALPQTEYLVEAAAAAAFARPAADKGAGLAQHLDARASWVIELFDRLERRGQVERSR